MSAEVAPDTIAAIATPGGPGGIGIVRVSGERTEKVARRVLGKLPPPRLATRSVFRDAQGEPTDEGIALYFPAPDSYTGESVLELQGHAGDVVLGLVLKGILGMGVRLAKPGEFSERAFLNDKLDLTQVEAVADLIGSSSEAAARAALQSLQGKFSKKINSLGDDLLSVRALLEAQLDFPDEEDVELVTPAKLQQDLQTLEAQLVDLVAQTKQGQLLRDGVRVALIGAPNVGKSSLLNYLTGQQTAIVTPIPGTTRDVVRATAIVGDLTLHLSDTAGLHLNPQDEVEAIGMERARNELAAADLVLVMTAEGIPAQPPCDLADDADQLFVHNKIDLTGLTPGLAADGSCRISLLTGDGLDTLKTTIRQLAGLEGERQGSFTARLRHLEALKTALDALRRGIRSLQNLSAPELLAEDLRVAHEALGQMTGRVTTEHLLGEIFASFCIGK